MLKLIILISLFGSIFSTYCPNNQVWDDCGSACPPTCATLYKKDLNCITVCVEGCRCKDGLITVKNKNGDITDCITRDRCPPPSCNAPLVWNSCGSDCTVTCDQPLVPCNKRCAPRCQCPQKTPLQDIDFFGKLRCVSKSQCCPKGKVFNPCGSACPPTCNPDDNRRVCPDVCKIGCTCPKDKPIEIKDGNGNFKCISRDQCPSPKCTGGQVWMDCGSACNRTCDRPVVPCTLQCVRRCQCPHDKPLQDVDINGNIRCIAANQCCTGDMVFNLCGSSCPGPSCSPPKPVACPAVCVPKCTCPRDKPIHIGSGKCISRDECPKPKCPGNQVFKDCGSACIRSCERPQGPCTDQCVARCECPEHLPLLRRDLQGNVQCIKPDQCCSGDLVFSYCASACPPSCVPPKEPIACPAVCKVGCTCPSDRPIQIKPGKCISQDQCPRCTAPLEWNSCASACIATCDQPLVPCNKRCAQRCQCPPKTPLQDIDFNGELRCVAKLQCCPKGKVFNPCGSACPPTCNPDNRRVCPAVCKVGCTCPKDKPIEITDDNGNFKCISRDQCPPPKCTGGQVWKECGSPCNRTCDRPVVPCNRLCVRRCECPHDKPIQDVDINGKIRCIAANQCCAGDFVYNPCGSSCPGPSCTPTKPIACAAVCVPKCTCPRDKPIQIGLGKCISRVECPRSRNCPGNQVFKDCGSACIRSCERPEGPCTKQCVARCECPQHLPLLRRDLNGNIQCIKGDQCCSGDLVFSSCASACPPSCVPPKEPIACPAVCKIGCTCPRDRPIHIKPGKCISQDQCPKPGCTGGQVWMKCGSACTKTCLKPNPLCTKQCVARCQCPKKKPIWHNGRCVKKNACRKGGKKRKNRTY